MIRQPNPIKQTSPSRHALGAGAMHKAIEFLQWANAQRTEITWRRIADRFHVSRATAFRWLGVYRDYQANAAQRATTSSEVKP